MPNQIECRPYSPRDESAILDLFQTSFGKEMGAEYWQWRFRDNPTGQIMVELAWDEDTLAAHYAVSPVVLTVKGHDQITALSMTTMTHPHYRGRGLFPTLSTRLYKRLRQQNYLMVWGFPNNQSHWTFINRLVWKDIYEIPMFHLNIENLPTIPEVSKCIVELSAFDRRFDSLWVKVRLDNDIWVKRDQKYLNWRYILNPEHEYNILAYIDGNELLGYAVFKEYNFHIDIVDILTVRDNKIGRELILAILDISHQRGKIKGIDIWLPVHQPLHYQLEKIGFINSVPVTYFGTRVINNVGLTGADFTTFSNWYIQMGDSDVY